MAEFVRPDDWPLFVGRDKEIKDIKDYLLGGGRVVLVEGPHLVGKKES